MKKFILLLMLSGACVAQTHVYGALDTTNAWTGNNSYTGQVVAGNGTTGFGFACTNMVLSSLDSACFQLGAKGFTGTPSDSQSLLFDSINSGGSQIYGLMGQRTDGSIYIEPPGSTVPTQNNGAGVIANLFEISSTGLGFECNNGPLNFSGGSGDCFFTGSLTSSGTSNSQSIAFRAISSSAAVLTSIFGDSSGNLHLVPAGTGGIFIPGTGGGGTTIAPVSSGTIATTLPPASGTLSIAVIQDCGTLAACANTVKNNGIIVRGSVAFPTATTVALSSLPFTSSTSYSCTAGDVSSAAGVINATTYTSGSAVTFTETGGANTDTVRYVCIGF